MKKDRYTSGLFSMWLREQDSNLRPSGYEPDELPCCSIPRQKVELYFYSGKVSRIFLINLFGTKNPYNFKSLLFKPKSLPMGTAFAIRGGRDGCGGWRRRGRAVRSEGRVPCRAGG